MPLAHLIFFAEPREFTEAQIEEARALGHLREDAPAPSSKDLFGNQPQVPDLSQEDK